MSWIINADAGSPADSPRTGNMTNQNFQFHFLLGKKWAFELLMAVS